ncbi:hypothetical protein MTP99_014629 [Tenebrio molitor]|jgi:hypothetical protein|nr:hypothetical protein MTP99_014629 [Tenebrio molitor]
MISEDLKRHELCELDYTCPMNTNKARDRGASSVSSPALGLDFQGGGFIIATELNTISGTAGHMFRSSSVFRAKLTFRSGKRI